MCITSDYGCKNDCYIMHCNYFWYFRECNEFFVRNLTATIHRLLSNGIDEKFIWKFTYK